MLSAGFALWVSSPGEAQEHHEDSEYSRNQSDV